MIRRRCRHAVFALLLCLPAGGAMAVDLSDCDSSTDARTLQAVAMPDPGARAAWLSARDLFMVGAAPSSRFRLVHSAHAALRAAVGQAVQGADGAIELVSQPSGLPEMMRDANRYLGAGVALRMPDDARVAAPDLLEQQVLVVEEDAAGRVLRAARPQVGAVLDAVYADAAWAVDLGVSVSGDQARFALWAPTAERVALCLYPDTQAPATAERMLTRDAASGVWSGDAAADGQSYLYLVDVFVPGVGRVRNRITDPYSVSLGADSRRSLVGSLDEARFKPAGWDSAPPAPVLAAAVDSVIYELHVRDFSIGDDTVPLAHRGKFLAFTDSSSNGMRHLQALALAGLTDVHLLPVFDFATVPETGCATPAISARGADPSAAQIMATAARGDCFNWGYDPLHFSAPEGSYASNADDGAVRVAEFRAMVMGLHAAGLRVGMDVVYNHVSAAGQDAQSVLDRIVPGYYLRLDAAGGVEHSTCCANTATERRMMEKLMSDSVLRWARDYRVDSFRFDLMGHQPRAAMVAMKTRLAAALGREVPMLGEGWNFGEVADGARFVQAAQGALNGSGIATFSDRARDAVRGGGPGDQGDALLARKGWSNGLAGNPESRANLLAAADQVRIGLAGSLRDVTLETADGRVRPLRDIDYHGQPAGYVSSPDEVVNYVENHDNHTLFDINTLKLPPATPSAERARVQVLALATVAFSQGIAYFHAGGDTLRSKSLDRNSFDSGDWFNRIDWTYRNNYFGTGLPPRGDNAASYRLIAPLLADRSLVPMPADIAWTRDAFRDLLRIRRSSTLFRLRTAAQVQQRLRFYNTGTTQQPAVVVARLDGVNLKGAGFARLMILINADTRPHTIAATAERGLPWQLHPVHRDPDAADRRILAQATVDAAAGAFTVPARSAVVFVVP